MKRGFTLVELLVSMLIFTLVIAAVITVFVSQHRKTIQVQNVSSLQTDAQVAFEILKWDLRMAGFGLGPENTIIISKDGGADSADQITIYGAALGLELATTHFNISNFSAIGSATNELLTTYWWGEDTVRNIRSGDYIIGIEPDTRLLLDNVTGSYVETTYLTPDSIYHIIIDRNITYKTGTIFLGVKDLSLLNTGVTYYLDSNNILWRNNTIFLENVEDIQFAYGIDGLTGTEPDGEIDPDEWTDDITGIPQSELFNRKFAIRVTLIVRSKGIPGFKYGKDRIVSENRVINLTSADKRFDRLILQGVVYPRNLNFE